MRAFCLLNHQLTPNQIRELNEKYSVSEITYPDKPLSKRWSQIPATSELDMGIINDVISWLSSANTNDVLIVQGEFGSTFMVVDYALKLGIVALHAVTKRVAHETRDGEIVRREYVFEHVCFRQYKYFEKNYKTVNSAK